MIDVVMVVVIVVVLEGGGRDDVKGSDGNGGEAGGDRDAMVAVVELVVMEGVVVVDMVWMCVPTQISCGIEIPCWRWGLVGGN